MATTDDDTPGRPMTLTFETPNLTVRRTEVVFGDPGFSPSDEIAHLFSDVLRMVDPARMGLVLAVIVIDIMERETGFEEWDRTLCEAATGVIQYWIDMDARMSEPLAARRKDD